MPIEKSTEQLNDQVQGVLAQKGNSIAQLQIQGFPFNETPAFGTEGCMGCHYSSAVAVASAVDRYGRTQVVYAPPSSGDFSRLLQLKA